MGRSRAGFELLDWGDRRWKHGRDTCPLAAADRSRIAEYVAGKRFSCATQKIAHSECTEIQSDSEDGMCRKTFQPGLRGIGRS